MADESDECIQGCERFSKKARRKAADMDCGELLNKINELTDREKSGNMGTKGLIQRFEAFRGDDVTHGPEILRQQRSLRTYLDEYDNNGCGDPPAPAVEVATRKLEVPVSDKLANTEKALAVAGAGIGFGYIAYRVLRFLPSLAPPLWWTIPENLAIP